MNNSDIIQLMGRHKGKGDMSTGSEFQQEATITHEVWIT